MKNGDMPAMPVGDGLVGMSSVNDTVIGITKREYFAIEIFKSMESACPHCEALGYSTPSNEEQARAAISKADAILAELEKDQ